MEALLSDGDGSLNFLPVMARQSRHRSDGVCHNSTMSDDETEGPSYERCWGKTLGSPLPMVLKVAHTRSQAANTIGLNTTFPGDALQDIRSGLPTHSCGIALGSLSAD